MNRGVCLVLPRVLVGRHASGDVVDQQGSHQVFAVSGAKISTPKRWSACERSSQGAVLDHRPGACRRSDVEGDQLALVSADGGSPALIRLASAWGLDRDEAVTDPWVGARRVSPMQEPTACGPAQGDALPASRGLSVPHRRESTPRRQHGDDEDVCGGGQVSQRRVRACPRQAGRQHVGGNADSDVGTAVGVQVVAQDEAPVKRPQPLRHLGHLGQKVDTSRRSSVDVRASAVAYGDEQPTGAGSRWTERRAARSQTWAGRLRPPWPPI